MRHVHMHTAMTFAPAPDAQLKPGSQVPNLSGAVVPVVPGGSTRPLTYDNRMEYVEAVLRCRLGELDRQMDAIRAGVACIVPARLLCLFTG